MKKKRSVFSIIVYAAIMVLLFSWVLGIFDAGHDGLKYSEVIDLFHQEKVRAFVVKDGKIQMELHEAYPDAEGKKSVTALFRPTQS